METVTQYVSRTEHIGGHVIWRRHTDHWSMVTPDQEVAADQGAHDIAIFKLEIFICSGSIIELMNWPLNVL